MNKRYQFISSGKAVTKLPNAWDLYHQMFQNGDEVLVITEDDKIEWGKVTAKPTGCWLRSTNKHEKFLEWDDIRFMSHDGFPVKKLMGADGSKNIEKLDTKETQELIRNALSSSVILPKEKREVKQTVFGDPFLIENFKATLLNPRNIWQAGGFNSNAYEEIILLKHKNGAEGMLWGIPTCYYFNPN